MKPTVWGLILAAKPFVLWAGFGLVYGKLIWNPVLLIGMAIGSVMLFFAGRAASEIETFKEVNADRRRAR